MYRELLELCGFTPEEIEREGSRADKVFKIVKMGPEDIRRAEQRIAENFDIKLVGIRKILGVWLREFFSLVLGREERKYLIHHGITQPPEKFMAATLASEKIYAGDPGWVMSVVLGGILGKIAPVLEAGERNGMSVSSDHCGLNKIRLGGYILGIVPKPDSFSACFICDEAPKTEEFICELFNIPSSYVQTPLDQHDDTYPELSLRQIKNLADSLRRDKEALETIIGFELTDELVGMANNWRKKIFQPYGRLLQLVASEPQPLSQTDMALLHHLVMFPIMERERTLNAMETLVGEVAQRVKAGIGVVAKGAPRVIIPILPSLVDPYFSRMVEECGLAIAAYESFYVSRARRPLPEVTDPVEVSARRFIATNFLFLAKYRIERIIEACQELRIDGVLWANHHSCRPGATDAMMIKKAVSDRLGLPMIILDWELYDPRYYSYQQLRTRIETFAEMLRMAKVSKAK